MKLYYVLCIIEYIEWVCGMYVCAIYGISKVYLATEKHILKVY